MDYGRKGSNPMKMIAKTAVTLMIFAIITLKALAGPYPPAAGQAGSTAVFMDNAAFINWATGWQNYKPGAAVTSTWQDPQQALGPAEGTSFDIMSLGRGGEITLTFDQPIRNGPGWDFAVFENSFSDTFLELAYVEVSSDGETFVRFDNDSLSSSPVSAFGSTDPTDIQGFGGKYRQGYGTPFDLGDLSTKDEVLSGAVQLYRITHVKIVDIIGDGSYVDTSGDVIYDPYPTSQSAGFDLDAVGIRYEEIANSPPDQPIPDTPANDAIDVAVNSILTSSPFSDPDIANDDFHYKTHWQLSLDSDFTDPVLDLTSSVSLTELILTGSLLQIDTTYFWHVKYFDNQNAESDWSQTFSFTTTAITGDTNGNGIPDTHELDPSSTVDLNADSIPDVTQISDQYKVLNAVIGQGQMGVAVANPNAVIEYIEPADPDQFPEGSGGNAPQETLLGLISFRLQVQYDGDTETLTVYLSESVPDKYHWYKYDFVKGWYVFPDAALSPDRLSVTLTLTDGGAGDSDGLVNGIIIDPGGAGIATASSGSEDKPKSGSSGISGGSVICFITTAAGGIAAETVKKIITPVVLALLVCIIVLMILIRSFINTISDETRRHVNLISR
jgi:hypothetical protein